MKTRAAFTLCTNPGPPRGLVGWAVAGTLACLWPTISVSGGAVTLPVPCVVGSCGSSGPQAWVTSGSARAVQAGTAMTVTQQSQDVTLNWQSFNISSNGTVTFKQPNASAVALAVSRTVGS